VGRAQGFGAGVAAGFMPSRGDETFSADIPKYAVFAGVRRFGNTVQLDLDLSAHAWRPRNGAPERNFLGWSQRLGLRRVRLDHRIEVDRSEIGGWGMTRLDARVGVPVGSRLEVSAEYFRDRLDWWNLPLDSLTVSRSRERLTTGAGYQLADAYLSADLTLLLSGADVRGRTYSGSLRLPEIAGRAALGAVLSYWTMEGNTGLVVAPALDLRSGAVRSRLGYEYFRSTAQGVTTATHGADLNLMLPVAQRVESMLGVTLRYGQHLRSGNAYSSLRLTF
jgi:hypothetical protein